MQIMLSKYFDSYLIFFFLVTIDELETFCLLLCTITECYLILRHSFLQKINFIFYNVYKVEFC